MVTQPKDNPIPQQDLRKNCRDDKCCNGPQSEEGAKKQPLFRDRIRELRRVRAGDLRTNPRNWRTHNEKQRQSMQGVLQQVGFAGALLARELDDGTLELIDGHLRAGMADDQQVPVLVVDVDRSEADLLLATHDPIGEMAGTDQSALNSLLADLDSSNNEVSKLLTELANRTGEPIQFETIEPDLSPIFQVIVDCDNEQGQKDIYEVVTAKGYTCRIVSI